MKKTCGSDTFPPSLSIILVLLQLLSSSVTGNGKADFTVSGPGEPIWAMVGADADLPCHLSPNISVEDMEMRWYRDQPSQAVHVHKKGKDMQEEQMVRYRGRTSLARAGLAQGQATVRIYNISALDNGTFHCHFKDGTTFQEATLQLRVAASFSRRLWSTAEWRIALPLTLAAVALKVATVICLFWKLQREKNRKRLEEERLHAAEAQDSEASRNRDSPLHVSPSLDPDTASPKLALSEDGKSVRRQLLEQELPDDPGRFDLDPCVLGQERLSAGRYYWEVQVGRRKAWTLGVCLESVGRKGRVPKSPQHGIWALELYKKVLWALAFPRVRLHPPELLCQVGILLDCDAGRVSFHHVSDGSLVYVFTGLPISAPLRPFFCLWTHDPSPLTVCSGHQPPEASDPQGQGQERARDLPPMGETLSSPVHPSLV